MNPHTYPFPAAFPTRPLPGAALLAEADRAAAEPGAAELGAAGERVSSMMLDYTVEMLTELFETGEMPTHFPRIVKQLSSASPIVRAALIEHAAHLIDFALLRRDQGWLGPGYEMLIEGALALEFIAPEEACSIRTQLCGVLWNGAVDEVVISHPDTACADATRIMLATLIMCLIGTLDPLDEVLEEYLHYTYGAPCPQPAA